jgi:hypothetical protein
MLFVSGLLIPALLQISVMQCDADPSGKRDSTTAFAKCLADHPSGDLLIPVGRYQIKGTITKNRNQSLIGMGSKASVLACESTISPCIVAADSTGGVNNYSVSSIENLGIEGPGPGNASIGIYLGADPAGKINTGRAFGDAVNLIGVRVTGFNHGVEWGNNAYVNKIVRSLIFANDVALFVPKGLSNSGEAISLTDSDIFNNRRNGIEDHSNFEWFIQGTSFDYNHTAIEFYGATIHAVNCHFEQESAQVFFQPFGMASLSVRDSEILIQANSGDEKYVLGTWPQSLNLVIDNVSIWANHPVHYFMHRQGEISGTVANLHGNGNKKIGAFSDVPEKPALKPSEAF